MYKDIFQHEIFKNELDFRLYTLILGNAVYQEKGVTIDGVHVKKGQWLRSYRKLAKDLEYKEGRAYKQYGLASIKRAVERLEKHGFIRVFSVTHCGTNSGTDSGTLFEVVEFEKYQGVQQSQVDDTGTDSGTDTGTGSGTKLRSKRNKEINNNRRKHAKRIYDTDSPYMKMTQYFRQKIREWKPDVKFKGDEQSWADEFRKIHELDNRSKQDIKKVIDWATSHPFWQANILSPRKLRDQFDTLQGQMSRKIIQMPQKEPAPSARPNASSYKKLVIDFD